MQQNDSKQSLSQNNTKVNLEQAYRFLREVHRDIGNNYFTVCAFTPGMKGESRPHDILFAQSPDEAMPFIKEHVEKYQIYYSVAWQAEKKTGLQKGGIKDCVGGSVLWAELDLDHPIKTEGKAGKYPKDYATIKNILADLPAPSVVIFSGHGFHLLWLLQKPMNVEDHNLHDKANSLPKQWLRTISYHYEKAEYTKPDATQNIDRILRLPGTFNLKDPADPVLAQIVEEETTWARYSIEYLKKYIVPADVEEARNQVAAAVAVADDIVLSPDAELPKDKFGQLRKSPKFRQLWEMKDPTKKSLSEYDLAIANIAVNKDWNDQEIANLLIAFRRKHAPHDDKAWKRLDYIKLTIAKARANNKVVSLDDKRQKSEQTHVDGNVVLFPNPKQNQTLKDYFPDIPETVAHLRMPEDWEIRNGMLIQLKKTKDGVFPVEVSQPIFISRLVDRKNGSLSKVELLFRYRGSWKTLIAERAEVFTDSQIVKLGNQGLPVSSANKKQVVQFLQAFYNLNELDIHYLEAINHLGWTDETFTTFIASPEDTHGLYFDVHGQLREAANALKAKGTLEGWIEGVKPYVKANEEGQAVYPIARAVIDAYFASPLLPILEVRSFIIHTYCKTGGGKTASSALGASAWGYYDDLKITFNSTKYSIELHADLFKHIPMFMDELQSVAKRYQSEYAEQVLYLVANNVGRGRGSKNGNLQDPAKWNLIVNTSGERPLTTEDSQGGAKNRALELYGKPIPDTLMAQNAYRVAKANYGTAGKAFIQRVQEEGVEEVIKAYNMLAADIDGYVFEAQTGNSPQHVDMVAVIATADYLVSQWLFGKTEELARLEALNLAKHLLGCIETASNIDDAERARDHIESWIFENGARIPSDPKEMDSWREQYGWKTIDEICLSPNKLRDALKEGGFEPTRILKDWKEREWIVTEGNRLTARRYTPTQSSNARGDRIWVCVLKREVFLPKS